MGHVVKPFGHAATVRVKRTVGQDYWTRHEEVQEVKLRRQGTRRTTERAARALRGFQEIVSVEEHSREEYERAFGSLDFTEHGPRRKF